MKKLFLFTFLFFLFGKSFSNTLAGSTRLLDQPNGRYESLLDLFKSYDKNILQSENELEVTTYLVGKNREIIAYLSSKYPQYGPFDMINIKDPDVILFGLYYAMMEANNFSPISKENVSSRAAIPEWILCAAEVIGAGGAIWELLNGTAYTSAASAWSVVKKIAKRYAGWLGVGLMLYEIATECF